MSSIDLTPLQRAQALAQAPGASKPVPRNEQLATPFIPNPNTGWSPSFDLSTGSYSWKPPKDLFDTQSVFDQVGVLTPVTKGFSSTFEQIANPSGHTPGESQTVDRRFQISYRQRVGNRTPPPGTPKPANQVPANLGRIGTNAGRLVVLGTLDTNHDDVDTYTFDLQNTGNLHVLAPDPNSDDATKSLGPVHLQVFDSKGTLLADSDPKSGSPYITYVKLDQNILTGPQFDKGRYTVKLSYKDDAPEDAKGDYSLFILEGTDPGRVSYYTAQKPNATHQAPQPVIQQNLQPSVLGLFV
jgi:hypothetical protein